MWLVSSGTVPESLEKKHPGNMSHARVDWHPLIGYKHFICRYRVSGWELTPTSKRVYHNFRIFRANKFLVLNAMRDFDDSRISFVVVIKANPTFHSLKNQFFLVFFYDWGAQVIVLVSLNFAKTFKTVRFYEFPLT